MRVWLGLKGLKEARGWGKQGVQENRWGGIRREFMGVRAWVGESMTHGFPSLANAVLQTGVNNDRYFHENNDRRSL